jgi:hypothetical protein
MEGLVIKMEQLLIQNRTKRTEAETLRNFLIKNNMDVSICRICRNNLKRIYIHHTNGNVIDNKINNLVVLCSFCHHAIHFKPNSLIERNKTIIKELIKGKLKSEETKKRMSLAKKDKTYNEIYGEETAILKSSKHSDIMKKIVNNYKRDEKGRFLK